MENLRGLKHKYKIGTIAFDGETWWWLCIGTHWGQGGAEYGPYNFGCSSYESLLAMIETSLDRDAEGYKSRVESLK